MIPVSGFKHLLSCKKDQQGERDAEEGDDHSTSEEDGVCVRGIEEIRPVCVVLYFEKGIGLEGRFLEAHCQKRNRCEQLS